MVSYKLLRQRRDGSLGPLFINSKLRLDPQTCWLPAENHPTRGFKQRPGWHSGRLPHAPHLTEKGRIWCEVELPDFEYTPDSHPELFTKAGDMNCIPVNGFYRWQRPERQGGEWFISGAIRIIRTLSEREAQYIIERSKRESQSRAGQNPEGLQQGEDRSHR